MDVLMLSANEYRDIRIYFGGFADSELKIYSSLKFSSLKI
jgi:hypothetical protein